MLLEAILPGAVAFPTALVAALVCRRLRSPPLLTWAIAFSLAYVAAQLVLDARAAGAMPSSLLSPREARDWLPAAVLLSLGWTVLAAYAPPTWRRGILCLAVLLAIAVPVRLLAGPVAQRWSLAEKLFHLALLSTAFGLVWWWLSSARPEEHPRARAVLAALVAASAAIVFTWFGSFTYGQLAGALAAAMLGAACGSAAGPDGGAAPLTFSFGSLLLLSYHYAQLTATNVALLLLALALATGRVPNAVARFSAWQQAALRATLCLILLGIALLSAS